jgi:hypothetical protein
LHILTARAFLDIPGWKRPFLLQTRRVGLSTIPHGASATSATVAPDVIGALSPFMAAWPPFVPFGVRRSEVAFVQIFHDDGAADGHGRGAGPGGFDGVADGIGADDVQGVGVQGGGVVGNGDVPREGREGGRGGREGYVDTIDITTAAAIAAMIR